MWQLEALSRYVSQANPWIFFRMSQSPPPLNYSMYSTGRNFILSCPPRFLLGTLLCFSTALIYQVEVSWIMVNVKSAFIAEATLLLFSLTFICIHNVSPYNFHIAHYSDLSRLRSLQSHAPHTRCNENHKVSFFNAVIPCHTWGLGERRSDHILLGKTTYQLLVGKICLRKHRLLIDTPFDCHFLKCRHFFWH